VLRRDSGEQKQEEGETEVEKEKGRSEERGATNVYRKVDLATSEGEE
jgi:hypothetical protein